MLEFDHNIWFYTETHSFCLDLANIARRIFNFIQIVMSHLRISWRTCMWMCDNIPTTKTCPNAAVWLLKCWGFVGVFWLEHGTIFFLKKPSNNKHVVFIDNLIVFYASFHKRWLLNAIFIVLIFEDFLSSWSDFGLDLDCCIVSCSKGLMGLDLALCQTVGAQIKGCLGIQTISTF